VPLETSTNMEVYGRTPSNRFGRLKLLTGYAIRCVEVAWCRSTDSLSKRNDMADPNFKLSVSDGKTDTTPCTSCSTI
jgi:hypothetical protein